MRGRSVKRAVVSAGLARHKIRRVVLREPAPSAPNRRQLLSAQALLKSSWIATMMISTPKSRLSMYLFAGSRLARLIPSTPPTMAAGNERASDGPIDETGERVIQGGNEAKAANGEQR